ncbi:MAG: hypothetical protein M3P12_09935 [Gemmatimonadota bacterium]|nr:hypothetical protein [Gemmatimonadota bacterium]
MDIGAVIALTSILLAAGIAAVVIGGAWALGRQHERREALERGGGPDDLASRLSRMEKMLETLSTDVERIAEERRPALTDRV